MDFLVTTRLESIPTDKQIIMLDGTVPGWTPKPKDYHFDHHRQNGAEIQIQEITDVELHKHALLVTTQVDADACVAAAYCMLKSVKWTEKPEVIRKLYAIAYDCDYLVVPPEYKDLSEFATKAVAAMKQSGNDLIEKLDLPSDRKTWSVEEKEKYSSEAFAIGSRHIFEAAINARKFPGEKGEADEYFRNMELTKQQLSKEHRVFLYRHCMIADYQGMQGKYVDPRIPLQILKEKYISYSPITLSIREVFENSEFKGYRYTLGTVSLHPQLEKIDFTKGTFDKLTEAEKHHDPNADGWGGRKTVGGSGWNTPSKLTSEEVIDIVLGSV